MSPRGRKYLIGGVLPLLSAIIALAGLAIASVVSFSSRSSRTEILQEPTPLQLAATLARVGINPESLAAADVTDQQVSQVVALATAHLDAQTFAALAQADETVRSAERAREELARRVQGGTGTAQDVADLRAAEQAVASAQQSRQAILDNVASETIAALSQQQAAIVSQILANAAHDVPTQYKAVARDPAEWVRLRDALATCEISPRFGEDVDQACSALVAQSDADPTVAAAKSGIERRLPSVSVAFEQALGLGE